jgi:hypothetical protein
MKNKIIFMLIIAASYVLAVNTASAALISSSGGVNIFGTVYVDNDAAGDGSNSEARGVGNVSEIRFQDGSLLWSNVSHEIGMVFYGWTRDQIQSGLSGTTQFTSIGGFAEFFHNPLGTFNISGSWNDDSDTIKAGTNILSTIGAMSGFGSTAVGQFSQTGYSSNGYVNVESSGGLFDGLFENSQVDAGNGSLANMTFNISGDNLSTGGYTYSGTGDLSGVATVPAPTPLLLMSFGLIALGLVERKKIYLPI